MRLGRTVDFCIEMFCVFIFYDLSGMFSYLIAHLVLRMGIFLFTYVIIYLFCQSSDYFVCSFTSTFVFKLTICLAASAFKIEVSFNCLWHFILQMVDIIEVMVMGALIAMVVEVLPLPSSMKLYL